jgi:hypothetical protein
MVMRQGTRDDRKRDFQRKRIAEAVLIDLAPRRRYAGRGPLTVLSAVLVLGFYGGEAS